MRIIHFCLTIFISVFLMSSSCKDRNIEVFEENDKPTLLDNSFTQILAGTDELGRKLPNNTEVGDLRDDRKVGMFYFLWQGDIASKTSEFKWDLSKIIPQHPEVLEYIDHPNWGSVNIGSYYFWGEPIYGYYSGEDYWVHVRSMQLLTDAGVDFLILDATNAVIYEKQSEVLMKAIKSLQDQGKNPPTLVYYTNTASGITMERIYNTFYKSDAPIYYPSTWFILEGKPLIIGRTKETKGTEYESFFTYRESQWPNEPEQLNGWPWIDFNRPQSVYKNHKGEREIINVSVSQHPNPSAGMGGSAFYGNKDNWGRSYRNNSLGNPETDILYGYNFQEQWDYALEQDLPFVFVTGWNEWIAGRWNSYDGHPGHSYFVDQADPEYSRDIEPTNTAGLKDNYYMQLVNNIRRYKGINMQPLASKQISIKGLDDWMEVEPKYIDYIKDTEHREHEGAETNPKKIYINNTGRNDFHLLKVTRDKSNIYFYAETTENIVGEKDSNWMVLLIDIDREFATGWFGYDYRIANGGELQKFVDNQWKTITDISTEMDGEKLMYTIPANVIDTDLKDLDFEFKWIDNMVDNNSPMEWYLNGDAAPGGRFNFVYKTKH